MPRPHQEPPLAVFLNSRLVGRLNRTARGAIDFQYDSSWLEWDRALPISLSLPLREDRYSGAAVNAVLENLLPDSALIRRRTAERVRAQGSDAYNLLAAIGRDCVGALQFLPDGEAPGTAGTVDGIPVDDREIARLIKELSIAPLGLGEDIDFRISIAGAQEKTALLHWKDRWYKPCGTTATTHILKPRIGRLSNGLDLTSSVENEFLCLKVTAALGIPSADVALADFEDNRVLVVERFDRHWTADDRLLRLPQEDCCQALGVPPTLKYQAEGGPGIEALLNLLKGSDVPKVDQTRFLKATVAFWLLGATDGHAKNFSVFLSSGGRFRMTPLYDVISAQPSADAGQIPRNRMKLAMFVGTNRHYVIDTIMPRHFLQTAAAAGLGASLVEPVFADILATAPTALEDVMEALPKDFPRDIADSILGGFTERLRTLAKA
ncbi:type II toxin-antitoxin system HipA family toxin [Rhodospirillum rubrum]|uniref:HipA protein n=1 Tax=Rhodospirillum rubrum (strain ATCC 11170 / ATH 1.1.1 / DSM 467 / LMG 4362 / NCIMB 8255 / S1) TaxID=269796 RepID=Q2RRK2_RHORT|nr:type II toxin-antitoxin system HipA family toxin [Rhodospirillum rubrum]ABC23243.1 HipA protein [Rhodospirillum rubrum ATCC 11170]MBK5954877.1 toxin HipA [Rhodospirillum rubrum]QXG79218.1 type II toxin-antitoxin system HipA family toxin [Rhodospirillum rubrum]HAP98851.1 type II toxin-antitoxin system HipA family toxin [Rhodospirillum rubrum]HCF18085.1 type II toxin-antitoxin system HipA family toxin [Rhodospirillum rubrum]